MDAISRSVHVGSRIEDIAVGAELEAFFFQEEAGGDGVFMRFADHILRFFGEHSGVDRGPGEELRNRKGVVDAEVIRFVKRDAEEFVAHSVPKGAACFIADAAELSHDGGREERGEVGDKEEAAVGEEAAEVFFSIFGVQDERADFGWKGVDRFEVENFKLIVEIQVVAFLNLGGELVDEKRLFRADSCLDTRSADHLLSILQDEEVVGTFEGISLFREGFLGKLKLLFEQFLVLRERGDAR